MRHGQTYGRAFDAILDAPEERGAGICVQVGGQTVVDLWAGVADYQSQCASSPPTTLAGGLITNPKSIDAMASLCAPAVVADAHNGRPEHYLCRSFDVPLQRSVDVLSIRPRKKSPTQ